MISKIKVKIFRMINKTLMKKKMVRDNLMDFKIITSWLIVYQMILMAKMRMSRYQMLIR